MKQRTPASWPTRIRLVAGMALVVLVGLGCAPVRQYVDGYPVDSKVACEGCEDWTAEAERWLDATSPGHPEVVHHDFYGPDRRTADGKAVLLTRSGGRGDYIVAMTLADGTIRAILVACGVGLSPERCFTRSAADSRRMVGIE